MSDLTLCKMKPSSPFHLGTLRGENESRITAHSDTLFSGIVNNYRLLYGKEALEELLSMFHEEPPFLLSSSFPYKRDNYLFPIPMDLDLTDYTDEPKKYKKIRYITEGILRRYTENRLNLEELNEERIYGDIVLGEEGELSEFREGLFIKSELPHASIDRVSNQSQIYYTDEVRFLSDSGLYFLVYFKDESIRSKVEASIRLLGEEGLGGRRKYGRGLFEADFKPFNLESETEKKYALSLVYPGRDDVKGLTGFYSLVRRGGWVYSQDGVNMRKRSLRMFGEGSVFNKRIEGSLADVTPEDFNSHHVYRYGYGFYLGDEEEDKE